MSDIVERLRVVPYGWSALAREAANEIERLKRKLLERVNEIELLRSDNIRLRAALDKAQVDLQVAAGNLDRAGYAMFAENARIKANEARRALEGK